MGGVYGSNDTANSQNVNFNYTLALQAARDLYKLSNAVNTAASGRSSVAKVARPNWSGSKRDEFDQKIQSEGGQASTVSSGLVTLANQFAKSWSEARGEQDRINQARYTQDKENKRSWGEKQWDSVAGEPDYGGPPSNPPVPSAPDYAPTRAPIHPEYEHQGAGATSGAGGICTPGGGTGTVSAPPPTKTIPAPTNPVPATPGYSNPQPSSPQPTGAT